MIPAAQNIPRQTAAAVAATRAIAPTTFRLSSIFVTLRFFSACVPCVYFAGCISKSASISQFFFLGRVAWAGRLQKKAGDFCNFWAAGFAILGGDFGPIFLARAVPDLCDFQIASVWRLLPESKTKPRKLIVRNQEPNRMTKPNDQTE